MALAQRPECKGGHMSNSACGWDLPRTWGTFSERPLRDDVAWLFEISGLWLRNVGDRHDTKRQVQRMIRRILPRLNVHSRIGS